MSFSDAPFETCIPLPSPSPSEDPPVIKNTDPLKKYRAEKYDVHDEKYATQMKKYEIPHEFRDFTEGLMDETHINRFGLLQAIEDFQRAHPDVELSCVFQDCAFNYRPYQPCVIS